VSALPSYVPGARDGGGPESIKLSSNENPFQPLPSVREAIDKAAASVNRYPDMFSRELTEALAERYDLPEGAVAVGAGSVSVLGHALQAFCAPQDEVVYAWRSFEAYPILSRLTGATAVEVPLAAEGRHDLVAMARAVTERTKVVLLCSPNNPTGPAIRETEFEAFMGEVPSGVLVILDEAYVEFVRDPLVVDGRKALTRHPNLVIARTFSKAYGLAGLRVGFALGEPDVMSAIRACVTPFSLSGIAQAAALASLEVEGELFERVDAIVAERERTLKALRGQRWNLPEAQGNFFWFEAKDEASAFAAYLRTATPPLLVRPFDGEGVRINVGSTGENDHLIATLEAYPSRF
ncbi:MAG: histidinol-phosphate transaminase, partial [Demequinaceae bacterium]|nr:histidinol-phosphate transaminase [Demequinaceae bacterium]